MVRKRRTWASWLLVFSRILAYWEIFADGQFVSSSGDIFASIGAMDVNSCNADEDDTPDCPEKGCLPCPLGAEGRPHCACIPGYFVRAATNELMTANTRKLTGNTDRTVTSDAPDWTVLFDEIGTEQNWTVTSDAPDTAPDGDQENGDPAEQSGAHANESSTNESNTDDNSTGNRGGNATEKAHWESNPWCPLSPSQLLDWDSIRGWLSDCVPTSCGERPQPAHAAPLDVKADRSNFEFPQRAQFQCDAGYHVETQPLEPGGKPPLPPVTWTVFEEATCTVEDDHEVEGGVEKCKQMCRESSSCVAVQISCNSTCRLHAECDKIAPSACSNVMTKKEWDLTTFIEFQCNPEGVAENLTGEQCMPTCGDGRLVSVDHLPLTSRLEQCDDGNLLGGDGCTGTCRVEPGWVCLGGNGQTADTCRQADLFLNSAMWLDISGQRFPSIVEITLASEIALSKSLGCPIRDIEIVQVLSSNKAEDKDRKDNEVEAETVTITTTTTELQSRFHAKRLEAMVKFRVKVSDPRVLSVDKIQGSLQGGSVLIPKLQLLFELYTTLSDVYLSISSIQTPVIEGNRESGLLSAVFSFSASLTYWAIRLGPILGYFTCIGTFIPWVYWMFRVKRRAFTLKGRFNDISGEFKGSWTTHICGCCEDMIMCCGLILCLPARLADTWDSVGLMPYWKGVQRAWCCCFLYLVGCAPCSACLAGRERSEMRDFFGFGDRVKGNLETSDFCCYLCCPVCCVMQEAVHVDNALRILPPPATAFAYRMPTFGRKDEGEEDESDEDAPEQAIMDDEI